MGVADYGVTATGTTSYTSNSFLATAQVPGSLAVTGPNGSEMTFQLNVNLEFTAGGTLFVYWIQDVAWYDSSSGEIVQYENNIWNFSSPSECLTSTDVLGGGTVYPYSGCTGYYAIGTPDHHVLQSGGAFQLMVNASTDSGGHPAVHFLFSDGTGWTTFDTASFPWATSPTMAPAFVVNGGSFNPTGFLYYDAEFVMGGPGGGSTTNLTTGAAHLHLASWNGDNFETVLNANNSGADTAETIGSANSVASHSADGSLYANVASGSETKSVLWRSSSVSVVQVVGPGTNQSLLLFGTTPQPYLNGSGTFCIAPLTLDFQVQYAGYTQDLGNSTMTAGAVTILRTGTWANLQFVQSGLPDTTNWGVSVGADARTGAGSHQTLFLPLGTYTYALAGGSMYLPTPSAGRATVSDPSLGPSIVSIVWQYVQISPTPPSGQIDVNQTAQLSVTLNGSGEDTFSWTGLPPGCPSRNSSQFACTPRGAGPYTVGVSVTDPHGFRALGRPLLLTIYLDPTIATPSVTPAASDVGQTLTFSTVGTPGSGGDVHVWMGLPGGCASKDLAVLVCVPQAEGSYNVTVSITDSDGFTATSGALGGVVFSDPMVTGLVASPRSVDAGQSVGITSNYSSGAAVAVFSWTGLPAGCHSVNASHVVCTPHLAGSFPVRLTIVDTNGVAANATLLLSVFAVPSVTDIAVAPDSSLLLGQSVTFLANVTGGSGDLTYAWQGLPPGCLPANSATIRCAPTSSGTWNVSLSATDSNGGSGARSWVTFTVQPSFLGVPAIEGYALLAAGFAAVLAGVVVVVRRVRRTSVGSDPGPHEEVPAEESVP